MTTLDKLESVAQGLLQFEGHKMVTITLDKNELPQLFKDVQDEYGYGFMARCGEGCGDGSGNIFATGILHGIHFNIQGV
ncbi:hypothetical protein [uncultured Clostridium sp.]|uniref:hypothetical protein n=1 Tax=uncultured Clostridium sp. TaxID=59620 RepID=UPI00260D6D46|nr:hypothetical protein [uncultured Clostridium sp.]